MLIVAFITLFTIAGYIYGVSEMYQLYFYTSISVFSIILFVLTIAAVLFARPDNGLVKTLTSNLLGSAFARKILPSVIFIPLLLGLLAFIGQKLGFYGIAYNTAIMITLTIVFLVILVWSSMKSINHVDNQRLKTKKDLKKLVEELKHSNDELQQFAYITSHDLQEPLRSITSYAQLIEMRYKGQLDEDADDFIDFMVSGATRMKSMIQGLLDYSRIGTQGGEFKLTDTEEVLSVVFSNLKALIEENNAEITHSPLPIIFADENQINSVFQNLIGNALKFRKEGIKPKIHVSAQKTSNEYVFSVSDNGIGLEEQYCDRIFEVFKRLHAIGEYEGTGIGLSIVKRIIERHHGRIWVESSLGVGSTFYFTIPINK
jgi:signal transduction histidine kinase